MSGSEDPAQDLAEGLADGPADDLAEGRADGLADGPVSVLVHRIIAGGRTLATAESLTGGLLGAAITDVPGASAVYAGGVIAYATRIKQEILGVDAALLAARGAVDPQVAIELAEGVRTRFGADIGLSTTGVAGPEGQDGKPVGLVYVGVATHGEARAIRVNLMGTRAAIRRATVEVALQLACEVLG